MKRSLSGLGLQATAFLAAALAAPVVHALAPSDLLAAYVAEAGAPASPERGQKLFTTNFGRDLGFSCSSCHGTVPTQLGKDQVTEKAIQPLAPAFNPKRFIDRSKVNNAFNLNCKDVLGRLCSAGEKADVLSWLITLKP